MPPLSPRELEDEDRLAALVQRAKAGDADALNDLFGAFQPILLRIARIRLGARLRRVLDSGDVVEDANVVIVEKLESFEYRGRASLIAWLSRIVENKIHDLNDRWSGKNRDIDRVVPFGGADSDDAGTLGPPEPADGGPSPTSLVSRAEIREIYDACVQELPGEFREVILLRDYMRMEWPAICERLGRPGVDATRELHRRASLKLAQILGRRLKAGGDDSVPSILAR